MEVLNQNGSTTWPMSHMIYLIANRTLATTDCTVFLEFFAFLSWTQLNDHAVAAAGNLGFVPLSNAFHLYTKPNPDSH